jgi:hypothetical protein
MGLEIPSVLKKMLVSNIQHMLPPPLLLQSLAINVRNEDVPTVIDDLKSFFLSDNLRGQPNSAMLLRTLDTQLSSYESLIPRD